MIGMGNQEYGPTLAKSLLGQLEEDERLRGILLINHLEPLRKARELDLDASLVLSKSIGIRQLGKELAELLGQRREDAFSFPPSRERGRAGKALFQGFKVLVVDDNPVNLMLTRNLLMEQGVIVSEAEDGYQAMGWAAEEVFDLILMDIQMPNMSGVEAARKIREIEKNRATPIVALTAHAMPEEREQFLAQGLDGCITKPLAEQEMIKVLENSWTKRKEEGDARNGLDARAANGSGTGMGLRSTGEQSPAKDGGEMVVLLQDKLEQLNLAQTGGETDSLGKIGQEIRRLAKKKGALALERAAQQLCKTVQGGRLVNLRYQVEEISHEIERLAGRRHQGRQA
jgi:CheY-like chemotaxis protein